MNRQDGKISRSLDTIIIQQIRTNQLLQQNQEILHKLLAPLEECARQVEICCCTTAPCYNITFYYVLSSTGILHLIVPLPPHYSHLSILFTDLQHNSSS